MVIQCQIAALNATMTGIVVVCRSSLVRASNDASLRGSSEPQLEVVLRCVCWILHGRETYALVPRGAALFVYRSRMRM